MKTASNTIARIDPADSKPSHSRRAPICRPRRNLPHGMFLLDALIGMMILGAITAGVVGIANGQRRAAIQAADMRAALRAAEADLTCLETGRPPQSGAALRQLDTAAPSGWVWMEATGTSGSRRASLVGLVPAIVSNHGDQR